MVILCSDKDFDTTGKCKEYKEYKKYKGLKECKECKDYRGLKVYDMQIMLENLQNNA
jgi:hypothetical protein